MNIQEQADRYGITLLQAHRKLQARKLLVERANRRLTGTRRNLDWQRHNSASAADVADALDSGLLDTGKVLDALKAISK
jgi:hypothetical protein